MRRVYGRLIKTMFTLGSIGGTNLMIRPWPLVIAAALVTVLSPGCHGRQSGEAPPASLVCAEALPGSTLRYSNVVSDSETGDRSGFIITVVPASGTWTGHAQEAAGEPGAAVALTEMLFEASGKRISFGIPNGPDTSRFSGAISCDSIWGEFRAYRTTQPEPILLRRIH